MSRLGQSFVQPSLLFFRTSSASRTAPRFLNESRIIPPLSYNATIHALESLRLSTDALDIHYADEEGDPYAVELAGRIGGYVIGNDSDFVVLNSEGYLGYIPYEDMLWSTTSPEATTSVDDDDDFQEVRNSKAKKKPVRDPKLGRGLIPPDDPSALALSFTAYSPSALASHLKLPITLLPLLGALVGNDFTNQSSSIRQNKQLLFFDSKSTPVERITRVAVTMQSILSTASVPGRKQNHQVGSVMDLIDRTVNRLLARTNAVLASGEIDAIIESIVEAVLQYAIPKYDGDTQGPQGLWPTNVCALHEPDVCPISPLFSRLDVEAVLSDGEELVQQLSVADSPATLYLEAYRNGLLSPKIMDCLNTGTYWPRLFLENPDLETVGRLGRSIREWGYAILDHAVGLPASPAEQEETDTIDGSTDDEDELIDVVESDSDNDEDSTPGSDPLARLRGALHRLHDSDEEATEPPASASSQPRPRSRVITEYIRRGTRVAEEPVEVPILADLLASVDLDHAEGEPLLLTATDHRLTIMLRALDSDYPQVRALPPQQLMAALTLRSVLSMLHIRAQESGSKDRENERWTMREARCFLASFSWASPAQDLPESSKEAPPIIDRNIQLAAQVLQLLECIHHFAQILLLTQSIPSIAHLFSGKTFHSYLTRSTPLNDSDSDPSPLWEACSVGLTEVFGEEKKKKSKKVKVDPASSVASKKKAVVNRGLFGILGDVDV